jgi:uncharacterized protein YqjF (DUF2071 family)
MPVEALRPWIPARLEIDTFDGEAWVAAVPFRMVNVRPRWLPRIPGLSSFPELNLRTYVRLDDRPGVFFFSLDASSRPAVRLARRFFYLPYLDARMEWERRGEGMVFRSERGRLAGPGGAGGAGGPGGPRGAGVPAARFEAAYAPAGEVFHAEPGSLEHFLTERYCLYSSPGSVGGPGDRLYRAEVHHRPWPLQPAEAELDAGSLLESAGLPAPEREPHLHWHAVQRSPDLAAGERRIRGLGACTCILLIQRDEGVKGRIVRGDLCQIVLQHLGGGHTPLTNAHGQLLRARENKVVHDPPPLFICCQDIMKPNAGHQARREAKAERMLPAVACMPSLGRKVHPESESPIDPAHSPHPLHRTTSL